MSSRSRNAHCTQKERRADGQTSMRKIAAKFRSYLANVSLKKSMRWVGHVTRTG